MDYLLYSLGRDMLIKKYKVGIVNYTELLIEGNHGKFNTQIIIIYTPLMLDISNSHFCVFKEAIAFVIKIKFLNANLIKFFKLNFQSEMSKIRHSSFKFITQF